MTYFGGVVFFFFFGSSIELFIRSGSCSHQTQQQKQKPTESDPKYHGIDHINMSSSLLQVCLAIQVFLVAVYGCTPAPSGGSTRSNFQITYKKEDVQIARADRAPPARIGKR